MRRRGRFSGGQVRLAPGGHWRQRVAAGRAKLGRVARVMTANGAHDHAGGFQSKPPLSNLWGLRWSDPPATARRLRPGQRPRRAATNQCVAYATNAVGFRLCEQARQ